MTKDWYRSKTIWGAGLALAGALAGLFGVETGGAASQAATVAVTDLASAVGALIAILGRFQAREPIA